MNFAKVFLTVPSLVKIVSSILLYKSGQVISSKGAKVDCAPKGGNFLSRFYLPSLVFSIFSIFQDYLREEAVDACVPVNRVLVCIM